MGRCVVEGQLSWRGDRLNSMWLACLGERSRGTRGKVICEVPSAATYVSWLSVSPDYQLIALCADKQIYIIDVTVCTARLLRVWFEPNPSIDERNSNIMRQKFLSQIERSGSVVCLSVCLSCACAAKTVDPVWDGDSCGPKKHCVTCEFSSLYGKGSESR